MRKPTKISARRSSDEWSRIVASWRASELTAEEFAAREGLKTNTLKVWAWRVGKKDSSTRRRRRRSPALRVVPLEVVRQSVAPSSDWELELRNGSVLRVRGELSESLLRAILAIDATVRRE
jgi:hypothetical protein